MHDVDINLANWKTALMASIPLGGLFSRNATAYKWKAPFRCWMLHEAVLWRLHDLLTQSVALHQQGHGLGARILLRSGFETLATLIYLNQLMGKVLDGTLGFFDFNDKTLRLTIGSKNKSTKTESINIITILRKCEDRYPGIEKIYASLSESAHPSYEGLCVGYSKIDHGLYDTNFSNRWMELHGDSHLGMVKLCMECFEAEYNDVWGGLILKLEDWIAANDDELEAAKLADREAQP